MKYRRILTLLFIGLLFNTASFSNDKSSDRMTKLVAALSAEKEGFVDITLGGQKASGIKTEVLMLSNATVLPQPSDYRY